MGERDEDLIVPHGGYRQLKSFQIAQLVYDLTVRFCARYIDRKSRTTDQMVQAARSGVQNIAEGSQASGTSRKFEIKLTSVARASLEELKLDYEDFLRQRGLKQWKREDPLRQSLVDQRCCTVEEVAQWIREVRNHHTLGKPGEFTEQHKKCGLNRLCGQTGPYTKPTKSTLPTKSIAPAKSTQLSKSIVPTKSTLPTKSIAPAKFIAPAKSTQLSKSIVPTKSTLPTKSTQSEKSTESTMSTASISRRSRLAYPALAANAAITLTTVACYLLDRQISVQSEQFKLEGGFSERLYRIRSNKRSGRS